MIANSRIWSIVKYNKYYFIHFNPPNLFKTITGIILLADETEALKLYDVDLLDQKNKQSKYWIPVIFDFTAYFIACNLPRNLSKLNL